MHIVLVQISRQAQDSPCLRMFRVQCSYFMTPHSLPSTHSGSGHCTGEHPNPPSTAILIAFIVL